MHITGYYSAFPILINFVNQIGIIPLYCFYMQFKKLLVRLNILSMTKIIFFFLTEMVISFTYFSTAMFVPYFKNNFNKLLKGNTCVSNYREQASLYPIISYLYHQASLCHPVNWFLLWLPSLWPLPCVC